MASSYLKISYYLPFFPFCVFFPSLIDRPLLSNTHFTHLCFFSLCIHFPWLPPFPLPKSFPLCVGFFLDWSCPETCVSSINSHLKNPASPCLVLKSNGLMRKRCMTSAFYLFPGSLWILSHAMHLGMTALLEDSWTVTVLIWCFQTNTYIAGV